MHTDLSLTILTDATTILGQHIRYFVNHTSRAYATKETTREAEARVNREEKARMKQLAEAQKADKRAAKADPKGKAAPRGKADPKGKEKERSAVRDKVEGRGSRKTGTAAKPPNEPTNCERAKLMIKLPVTDDVLLSDNTRQTNGSSRRIVISRVSCRNAWSGSIPRCVRSRTYATSGLRTCTRRTFAISRYAAT